MSALKFFCRPASLLYFSSLFLSSPVSVRLSLCLSLCLCLLVSVEGSLRVFKTLVLNVHNFIFTDCRLSISVSCRLRAFERVVLCVHNFIFIDCRQESYFF